MLERSWLMQESSGVKPDWLIFGYKIIFYEKFKHSVIK